MTNKTTEALKLAEEALQSCEAGNWSMSYNELAVDEALSAIREALAEQKKQEPVGEVDLHKELGQLRWMGGDEGWDNAIHAVRKRLEELYAAPVNVKAIRAEDYIKAYQQGRKDMKEEAAKVCDSRADGALQAAEFAGRNALIAAEEATECATAIRKLK